MTKGTKEWSDTSVNIQFGCEHACKYCYALRMAQRRPHMPAGYRKNWVEWYTKISPNRKALYKGYGKRKGRVMFPTTHDITPNNIDDYIFVLDKLLFAGNKVLIVTKPHLECIKQICERYHRMKDLIQFRFTITSPYNPDMSVWEPFAPSLTERRDAVAHAFKEGFKTSLSIEPYLANPYHLIKGLEPHITESIWVGIMNKKMLTKLGRARYDAEDMDELYSRKYIIDSLYRWLEVANGKLRMKDSIQKLIGCDVNGNKNG